MKTAIYPGTFDPITNGHLDIVKKASGVFDEVIVAVAYATGKNTLFSLMEREKLCLCSTSDLDNVKVMTFDGLVVDFVKKIGADSMIRGLRAISDFEYELSLALMNKKLYDKVETIFFIPDYKYLYLSSTMIRQVVRLGGKMQGLIPNCVEKALIQKLRK